MFLFLWANITVSYTLKFICKSRSNFDWIGSFWFWPRCFTGNLYIYIQKTTRMFWMPNSNCFGLYVGWRWNIIILYEAWLFLLNFLLPFQNICTRTSYTITPMCSMVRNILNKHFRICIGCILNKIHYHTYFVAYANISSYK